MCGWNREIFLGGVRRRETDQEKKDRKMAMRLFKEQEEAERVRLRRIEQENKRQAEAEEVERQENERLAREAQAERERRERELRLQREEREREAREAQQSRVRRQKEESASTTLLQTNTKACPGNCGWRIEKKDGCDHMTCSRCGYQFCWICLASWTAIQRNGNTSHEPVCRYHSRNL
ncbi:hypothetical protein GJ744_005245 [Endocarpon pusillum]|uniref:RING-type domain-containing protein n=1 Tax=Endocarpon pusillum TaxID=364733 RepID=A0A8H7E178_9EURO|nr:hypothetical protein GJ744_005245 [Endocarpon pusillum]